MSTIEIKHGTEGSKHDPYSYKEITVHCQRATVMLHQGLRNFVKINGGDEIEERSDAVLIDGKTSLEWIFEHVAKITPKTAEKAYHNLKSKNIRSHACGYKHLEWVAGYPGETLLCCQKCGDTLDSEFNESEII